MKKYNEIFVLKDMLEKTEIPFEFKYDHFDGYQLLYPSKDWVCSVVEFDGSYGCNADRLEIMGLLTREELKCDSVKGYLSAKDVYRRIRFHYVLSEIKKASVGFFRRR